MTRQTLVSGFTILALGAIAVACKAGGVGDPCIPNEEYSPVWQGGSAEKVTIEDRSFQCETRVCMSFHFRGRVSCPFGNPAGGSRYTGADSECLVPGTNDVVQSIDPATGGVSPIAVAPQCQERKDAVYCTCRCDGTDSNAKYCECPEGYQCEEPTNVLDETIARPGDKYCIKDDDMKILTGEGKVECTVGCDDPANPCGYEANRAAL